MRRRLVLRRACEIMWPSVLLPILYHSRVYRSYIILPRTNVRVHFEYGKLRSSLRLLSPVSLLNSFSLSQLRKIDYKAPHDVFQPGKGYTLRLDDDLEIRWKLIHPLIFSTEIFLYKGNPGAESLAEVLQIPGTEHIWL